MKERDRLGFAYATRGCVPSRDIPFVGHNWFDEEEEQHRKSCKFPEQPRHDMQWNISLMSKKSRKSAWNVSRAHKSGRCASSEHAQL